MWLQIVLKWQGWAAFTPWLSLRARAASRTAAAAAGAAEHLDIPPQGGNTAH